MTRGRKPSRDWVAVLADARARRLSTGQVAREQGCPYGTVATAAERLGFDLRTDDRARRWDGIRLKDRHKSLNLETFSYSPLCDLTQNGRLDGAMAQDANRTWVSPDAIYVMAEDGGAFCKIGISANNDILRRIRDLRGGNPRELSIVFSLELGEKARRIERMAHSALWTKRAQGRARTEWFAVTPAEAVAAIQTAIAEDETAVAVALALAGGDHE
jgi:hypothetical protein